MNKRLFRLIFALAAMAVFSPANLFAQKGEPDSSKNSANKIWFIARVLNTEPLMLEYLDDWYRRQPSAGRFGDYGAGVDTNPQSQFEKVGNFKVGDIISGEFCHPWLLNCGAAVRVSKINSKNNCGADYGGQCLPPPVAVNLKKLGRNARRKYQNKGFLLSYRPAQRKDLIRGLQIFRDRTVILETFYGDWIWRRLSPEQLKSLEKDYLANRVDKIPGDKEFDYFKPQISTAFGQYRNWVVENNVGELKNFVSRLDNLIAGYVRSATYSIHYRWRFRIKDWPFGDIFPLDQAADEKGPFLGQNRQQLSQMKPPPEFLAEAKEIPGGLNFNLYRFKNQIYGFQFAICTDRPTDSWACYRVWNVAPAKISERSQWLYSEWPANLEVRLKDIPPGSKPDNLVSGKGLDIPPAELEKHREFYDSLFYGGKSYKEGDFIYADLTVKFR